MNNGGFITPTLDINPACGSTPSFTNFSANIAAMVWSDPNSSQSRCDHRSQPPAATISARHTHSKKAMGTRELPRSIADDISAGFVWVLHMILCLQVRGDPLLART